MTTYFAFAIADSMFPKECTVTRKPTSIDRVVAELNTYIPALNPSHTATIEAARVRYGLNVTIPETAPKVSLSPGDAVIVMSVRGLPRLDASRHEYTAAEIDGATFEFARWEVLYYDLDEAYQRGHNDGMSK